MTDDGVRTYRVGGRGSLRPLVEVHRLTDQHPRVREGLHAHEDLEVLYFAQGGGTHRIGERVFAFGPGDVFLVPPGVPHDLGDLGAAAGWVIEFDPTALTATGNAEGSLMLWRTNPLLRPFAGPGGGAVPGRITVPEHRRPGWERLLEDLQEELDRREEGYRLASSAQLVLLLVTVARLASDVSQQLRLHEEPLLAACFEVVEKRFRAPLRLLDVASEIGVSPGHLTTLVRDRTGRTVMDWVTERRMTEARHLLLATDLPVATVAHRVGFDDAAYFNRRFRQFHGVPPARWRRDATGDDQVPETGG